ncbi:hypothetical protein GCM10025879_04740 [Leuconostoc litchii]|nr:hypothetical protein GCM10025879_04740 [Leuconostoc litchii]
MSTYPEFDLVSIEKPEMSHISDARPEWADAQFVNGATKSESFNQDELKGAARLWPHKLDGEGHFVAKLVKAGNSEPNLDLATKSPERKPLSRDQQRILKAFLEDTFIDFTQGDQDYVLFGERLYLSPVGTPDITGMKILRLGLELGTFKKNRFEPAHALALSAHPDELLQTYVMGEEDWQKFVHGDVIQTTIELKKGWVLMVANGNGAGWGRYVNGQIKNFFPKGLRFVVKN